MKKIKNERGFTLIELLAVIVVLAIVLLMGAMAVIPRMNEARKQVFALEANQAIQAASVYLQNNTINAEAANDQKFPVKDDGVVCVKISDLIEKGEFDASKNYKGQVLVKKKKNSSVYLYAITMTNGNLMVTNAGYSGEENKDVTASDVTDASDSINGQKDWCNDKTWPTTSGNTGGNTGGTP